VTELSPEHTRELLEAKSLLERPSLAIRLTEMLGTPIEKGLALLPGNWSNSLQKAVRLSLDQALNVAVRSLGGGGGWLSSERFHKLAVVATGAGGGAFGLAGLAVELPVSTTLMLRSIADIARSQGDDLSQLESRLACLEVFALGGRSEKDDAAETGYFAVRSALAGTVSEAVRYLSRSGLGETGGPVLIRLLSTIGNRFGVVVTEKAAAMAIPALGAVGGALINSLFINHYQDMARGHFTVRRLERIYGPEAVRRTYDGLKLGPGAV